MKTRTATVMRTYSVAPRLQPFWRVLGISLKPNSPQIMETWISHSQDPCVKATVTVSLPFQRGGQR